MEVKTIKDVLDYIDCGIVNNNCNSNYIVYMELIHSFLLNGEEINSEFLFQLLQQTNFIILELFTHKNAELKNEYYEMRHIILGLYEKIIKNNHICYLINDYKNERILRKNKTHQK